MGRDALVILSMRIVGTVLWLTYTVVLARSLSQPDFASVIYVMNFSAVAVLIVTLGRDVALLKFASRNWADGNLSAIRRVLIRTRFVVVLSGLVMILTLLAAARFGVDTPVTRDWQMAALAGLLTATGAQMAINRDCLRAIGQVWQSQLGLNLTRSVIPIIGSGIAMISTGLSATGALLLFLFSLILSVLVEEAFLRRVDWRQGTVSDASDFPEISRMSMALWPGDIANAIQMRAAGLIAGLTLAPEAMALFLAAERIAGLAQFPIAAAAQAAAPKIAQTDRKTRTDTQAVLSQGGLLMGVGALTGVGSVLLLAYPALWALGRDYLAALPVVLILLVAHASWGVLGLGQTTLILKGEQRAYSILSILCCALGISLIWACFSRFGAVGGAIGFCVTWWCTNLVYTIAVRHRMALRTGAAAIDRATIGRAITGLRLALRRRSGR